jgi:hypothetical protein
MKARLLPLSIFILGCFVASAEEKEMIKDKSPDERFHARQPIPGPSVLNAAPIE